MSRKQSGPGGPAASRRTREQLVEAIVAAATELLAAADQGSDTVRAVAAGAEVQPSIIYRYFADEQALLGEVVARGARRDAEILSEPGVAAPPQVLAATLENAAYRAALLRAVLAGLRPADVPGGLPALALSMSALAVGAHRPARPGERYDPRLVAAVLAAALVGWQASSRFFSRRGPRRDHPKEVEAAVAFLLDQVATLDRM